MQDQKTSILYIDDEENNLTSFKASFRRDFDIHITSKADEAVKLLNEHRIHLIVADQKMPDISGVEFLELVKSEFPDPIRILLTGYADIEAVIDAINRGQVYRYITKPWDEQELRMVFQNAREHYDTKFELRSRNTQLSGAYKDLERFVYSASHDLRAPLASIRSIVDLARKENDHSKSFEYLEMVETNVLQLDYFTQNLINFYHNLNEDVVIQEFNMNEWFRDVLTRAKGFAQLMDIEVTTPETPSLLKTDPKRLGIAVNNLLVNAFKHGAKDNPELSVSFNVESSNNEIRLIVEDNGPGIHPKKLQEIKQMLSGQREQQLGFGLGLFIVEEVMKKLKGRTLIESTSGNGCKVTLILAQNND